MNAHKSKSLVKRIRQKVKEMSIQQKFEEYRTGVLDLNNKEKVDRYYYEKMKGRFRLRMSPNLSSPQKITKFAQEPIAFHLYKNRHFLNKINLPKLRQKRPSEVNSIDRHLPDKIKRMKKLRPK